MSLDEIHEESELRMMESVEVLEEKLRVIRTGRPNPALVTSISIEAYGAVAPLQPPGSWPMPSSIFSNIQADCCISPRG